MDASGWGRESGFGVLVVEDDLLLGRLIQRVLLQSTADVTVARSGAEALAALEARTFDAIASDISLPGMSGIDVIARAREIIPGAGIVAITGFVDVDVAVLAMRAGADDFLGKPFNAELLWHIIHRAVENRRRRISAEQAEAYRQLAYADALTGAPNRRYFDEFIVDAVARARQTGEPLTVAYLDIDNFKLLNDYMGHEQGDELLCSVANILREEVREPAVFARFGGDEFVVAFPGQQTEAVQRTLDRVKARVGEIELVNGSRVALPTRASCGTATFRGFETPRDLVAEAEDQMYLDKSVAASMAGMAMEHHASSLVKVSNLKALRSLVKAIDRRDSYTRFHSDHATRLALAAARMLGLPEEQVAGLTIGGPIHDLGKIVVPDEILRKPGPLTIEERRAMEEHPVMGAAITAAVTDYETVVDLVRHHHERFDGTGYPGRLAREEIALPTRLFTLADAYSAMTTDRPYRKGLTQEQAMEEIVRGSGTQFDPDLARVFLAMLEAQAAPEAA